MADQDDGWKVVSHRKTNKQAPKSGRSNPHANGGHSHGQTANSSHSHNPPAKRVHSHDSTTKSGDTHQHPSWDPTEATPANIKRSVSRINRYRDDFPNIDEGRQCVAALANLNPFPNLTNAIIMGLGPLDPNAPRAVDRAQKQLAMFLIIVDLLGITGPRYAWDPAFNDYDIAVLKEFNIEVREGALGKSTPQTFLMVPFVDAVVLVPEILWQSECGLYVGTNVEMIVDVCCEAGYSDSVQVSKELVSQTIHAGQFWLKGRKLISLGMTYANVDAAYLGLVGFVRDGLATAT